MNGHAPGETRAQTQEEAGDVTTTPHIISKTHRLCGAPPGYSPWERTGRGRELCLLEAGLTAELGGWLGDVSNVVLDC